MSPELLLLVCSANVCRSPFAELLLRQEQGDLPGVRVESAGVRVEEGMGVCDLVIEREGGQAWVDAARAHRARPVTRELLAEAALILVADRDVRSEVVLLAPDVRDRVFTLRDAAHLVDSFEVEEPSHRVGSVSRLGMHLNRHRAVRGPRPLGRRRLWGWREEDLSSIEDGHNASARQHRAALDGVASAVAVISSVLVAAREG